MAGARAPEPQKTARLRLAVVIAMGNFSALIDSMKEAQDRAWEPFGNPERRRKKMEKIDALPGPIKQVVHEYGWLTVKTLMDAGVKDKKAMLSIIKVILYEHSHAFRSQMQEEKR